MSVTAAAITPVSPALRRAALLGLALAAATTLRAVAGVSSAPVAMAASVAFAAALVVLAAPLRIRVPSPRGVGLGILGGAALVLVPLLIHPLLPVGLRPEPFVAWAAVTVLVAGAEEALLRGALFDALRETGGLPAAIVLSSIAFALMHVPLYGWAVVPIDLGAGLVLAGLRVASGGVAAPAVAHAVADLATWWL